MATVGSATFTVGSDTGIESYTPDVGAGFTQEAANAFTAINAGDALRGNGTTTRHARKEDDIGDDDMDVSADVTAATSTARLAGVCGRMASGNFANMYRGYVQGSGSGQNDLVLEKVVSNVVTELAASRNRAGESTVSRTIKLQIRTADKKLFENGVEILTTADDSLTGNNYAGLIMNGGTNITTSVDNFLSESVSGGGGAVIPKFIYQYRRRRVA